MTDFFRFPHTPHIAWLGEGEARDDKVLTPAEAQAFLGDELILEEKIDGANLGISVGSDGAILAQNRGQYLERPFSGQFSKLERWLVAREDALFDALGEDRILFGEWCEARHSLVYDRLPDGFLAFDVYERDTGKFWSVRRRDRFVQGIEIATVHRINSGGYTLGELIDLVGSQASFCREGPVEGIYLRRDEEDFLASRAKIVRPEFVQAIGDHWSSRGIERNAVVESLR